MGNISGTETLCLVLHHMLRDTSRSLNHCPTAHDESVKLLDRARLRPMQQSLCLNLRWLCHNWLQAPSGCRLHQLAAVQADATEVSTRYIAFYCDVIIITRSALFRAAPPRHSAAMLKRRAAS